MNIAVIVRQGETESFTMDNWEHTQLQEAVNDADLRFLTFERSGRKMMINKDHIIKIWWDA